MRKFRAVLAALVAALLVAVLVIVPVADAFACSLESDAEHAAAVGDDHGASTPHEDAGQGGPAGEVPGEEVLVTGQHPRAAGRLARHDLVDGGDEGERIPVREDLAGVEVGHGRRISSALSSFFGVS